MCFANTVLQVLVYSQSFHKLFIELGKYLPVKKPEQKEMKSSTPLVDATWVASRISPLPFDLLSCRINFMKEFHVDAVGPSRDIVRDEDEESDLGREAFVPTYVYEALKEKKRFDSMRVSTSRS